MTAAIDYQDYTGVETVPAAGEQPQDANSYQQTQEDYPVYRELLEMPQEVAPAQPSEQDRNFSALRGEVDRIKAEREAERREHQLQLDMLRANMAQIQQPPQQTRHQEMFADKDPSYLPNVSELRQEWSAKEAGYQARLEELEFQSQHPDYAEVISKYTAPLVKEKPHLAQGILASQQRAAFAYELGKMAQQIQAPRATEPAPQINQNAVRMVENSKRPGSISQAAGQTVLSKADYYASMSDSEFLKMANQHLESI